ncbi:MAG: DUF6263 family protein [Chitinophagaceae bacterium]
MKSQLLTLAFLLNTCFLSAQELKPWKINLPAGVAYRVETKSTQTISQEAMGQNMEMQNQTEVFENIQLQEVDKGIIRVEKRIGGMRMKMSVMGQEMSFDSDRAEDFNTPMGEQMKPVLERVVTASIDASGNIRVHSASVEDPALSAALGMFGDGVPDSLALAGLFMKAPERVIRVGESWTEMYNEDGLKQETKYTFLETKDQIASIAFEIASSIEKNAEMQGTTVQTNTKTQSKGVLKLDLNTGMVIHRSLEQTVEGTNNVMGMEIPLKGGGNTEVTITRVN